MESRKDTNNSKTRENLNAAILVQARLIAELRNEVARLQSSNQAKKAATSRKKNGVQTVEN